jgi:hypothetical protein
LFFFALAFSSSHHFTWNDMPYPPPPPSFVPPPPASPPLLSNGS